jgi:Tol biopolymer transport system component
VVAARLVLALAMLAVAAAACSSAARPPSLLAELKDWRLAYAARGGASSHLFVSAPDGSDRRQIDHIVGDKQQPNWSPDGEWIAFRWVPHDEDHTPLALVDARGTRFVNLTRRTGLRGWSPSWSPSGRQLVSAATPRPGVPNGLYIMDADGAKAHRITPTSREAQYAAWSPDGKRIAFTYVVDGGFDLFTVRPDGTGLHRLTHDGRSNWAMWSPDSRRIAWGRADELWVMNADGSDKRLVTSAGGVPGTWAPGPAIAFACTSAGGKIGLCAVRADGTGLVRLLPGMEANFPGWRPPAD